MRAWLTLGFFLLATRASAADVDIWIGTTTPAGGPSRGIYHLTLDEETGKLSDSRLAAEADEPGFLVLAEDGGALYSAADVDGESSVVAYSVGRREHPPRLRPLGAQPTGDGGACHVALDRTERVLLSAQYGGGSIASYPIDDDGSIGPRVTLLEHDDPSGVVPSRQATCHPHWVGVSSDNRFVLVPDLGADRVYVHTLDATTGKLAEYGSVKTIPGGGPRHFKFHPTLSVGYAVNELMVSVSVFGWDGDRGKLKLRQTMPTLTDAQKDAERFNSGSEIRVHPSGRFVYAANRGHDSITAFGVDEKTGGLSFVENEPIRGSWPRNFNLSPSGRWLLAAGRDSHSLAVFEIDEQSGALRYTLETSYVPSPICVAVSGYLPHSCVNTP